MVIFVPMPTSLAMSTTPPSLAMFVLTTSRPTPRPLRSVATSLVVNPGRKTRANTSRSVRARGFLRAHHSATDRRGNERRVVHAAPSSSTSMTTWLPFWKALSAIVPTGGFPTRRRSSRWLDAVIDGVADHVHQRIAELLDDELVDLGLGAGDDEVHLLAVLARDLPHDARQLVERLAERHHAHLEDAALHLREVALEGPMEPSELDRQLARLVARPRARSVSLRHRGLHDRELADDGHQAVELADVDAHASG